MCKKLLYINAAFLKSYAYIPGCYALMDLFSFFFLNKTLHVKKSRRGKPRKTRQSGTHAGIEKIMASVKMCSSRIATGSRVCHQHQNYHPPNTLAMYFSYSRNSFNLTKSLGIKHQRVNTVIWYDCKNHHDDHIITINIISCYLHVY